MNSKKIFPKMPRRNFPPIPMNTKAKKDVYDIDTFITNNIKKANGDATDAYGQIEFNGNITNTAQYVKVSHNTKVEIIYQLITKHWHLDTPNLIISVTGGAKDFDLNKRLRDVFRKSLIKAAEKTGAWITTGGTRTGVMKHVGKAVKQYASIKDDKKRVVAIGVAPWEVIHERKKLLNHQGPSQKIPKIYNAEEGSEGDATLLDQNHSHFILVDNGMEDNAKYGSEIELRTDLERHIGSLKTSHEVNVMIVCVIVQGGPGSLETVRRSINNETPVVIVQGSGGWADVLAKASSKNEEEIKEDTLSQMITDAGAKKIEGELGNWVEAVKECISNKNLLTVFSLDPTDLSKDLDKAIMEALLKTNTSVAANTSDADENSNQQTKKLLNLALAWDRADIARSHILTDNTRIAREAIAELFFKALQEKKHEFCKVFLNIGVDLKEYFTVRDLQSLYKSAPKDSVFYKKLYEKDFSLQRVGELLKEYLGKSYSNVYKKRDSGSQKYCAVSSAENSNGEHQDDDEAIEGWSYRCKLEDPYREIFQWAILFNCREIAMYVFEYMHGPTQAAIVASRILRVLSSQMVQDQETKRQMEEDAGKYETLATGLFSKCYMENRIQSIILLIAGQPKWGGYTCLRMAIKAKDMKFVSSSGVQSFLDEVWRSKIADNCSLHIIAAGLFPPLIFTIQFDEGEDEIDGDSSAVKNPVTSNENNTDAQAAQRGVDDEENNVGINNPKPDLSKKKEYSNIEKIFIFYKTPIVTFWMNVISFLVYLGLFAYVILSNFQLNGVFVSGAEYVLLSWTCTLLFEEVREVNNQEPKNLWRKIRIHMRELWNDMDLLSLIMFFIGFGLRYYINYLDWALTLYAIAFMLQCMRLVHIFAVHQVLGPKIIMVKKMLKDLFFFLFILIVFLLAYGIASQALLYPGETSFSKILVGIIYRPYWHIYGELFLDEINYDPDVDAFTCSDTNASLPRCPRSTPVVPIMSALYLLLANVLLLNLLIAMFSYTFQKIHNQDNEIWMFQRYHLITDYYFRPKLVPPLIIFSHIYLFIMFICRNFPSSSGPDSEDQFRPTLKMDLNDEDRKELRRWEHWHAYEFFQKKHQDDEKEVDRQLTKLNDRMEEESLSSRTKLDAIIQKFNQLEKCVDSIKSPPKNPTKVPMEPKTKHERSDVPKLSPNPRKQCDEPHVHVKARCATYPDSKLTKVVVPADKVSWKVTWKDYDPPSYTHPTVAKNPDWADEDLEKCDVKSRPKLPYNLFDLKNKVLRRSHMGTYEVIEGIPRNPKGRTGIKGRGLLGRYGPNHAADPVVTRWKRNEAGDIVKTNNKPVLEFVAILRADTGDWAIPGGMVAPGETVTRTLLREFGEEALDMDGVVMDEQENIKLLFEGGGLDLFRGYCDDHRNTDNAWMETVACNFHDEVGDAFNHVKFSPREGETRAVTWIEVNHKLKLFASHCEYLRKTADMHNAYF